MNINQQNKIVESLLDQMDVGYKVYFLDQNQNWNSFTTLNEHPKEKELINDFAKSFKLNKNKFGLLFLQEEPKFDAKIYALTYAGIEPNVPTNCILFVGCSRKEAHALAYDLKFRTDLSAKLGKFFSSTLDFFGIGKKINRGIYWKN